MRSDLFKKYDVPAPRYTSYPTVPYWNHSPTAQEWLQSLSKTATDPHTLWSIYVHVPFCESLCTFCGCNNTITKNHQIESPYVDRLIKEKSTYLSQISALSERLLTQIHLGGGSPTFLSEPELEKLMQGLLNGVQKAPNFEGAIEVDPRRTRATQLEVLAKYGMNRISLGVQDFNPEVQRLINRQQSFEMTASVTQAARDLGYTSVNFDLIYGLPKQSPESIDEMVEKTLHLRPDRIALYSFALVPWIKPSQRLFKDEDLPRGEQKRELYERARGELIKNGYIEIGMDHFALPGDALSEAARNRTLHRNFMGYTDQKSEILLGLGVSAISETPTMFSQNEKVLPKYENLIDNTGMASFRGHILNDEDLHAKRQILELMTTGHLNFSSDPDRSVIEERLTELKMDEIILMKDGDLTIRPQAMAFLRNVCMAFDRRYFKDKPHTKVFSQSI